MLECLLLLFHSLISRVVRPGVIPTSDEQLLEINFTDQSVLLPLGAVNYGVTFMMSLEEARMESKAGTNMNSRCRDFLVEACKQVQRRLPANIQIWKSRTAFSPTVILSQAKPQLTSHCWSSSLAMLELLKTHYQAVTYHPWTNKVDSQAKRFWIEVLNYKDSSGDRAFK